MFRTHQSNIDRQNTLLSRLFLGRLNRSACQNSARCIKCLLQIAYFIDIFKAEQPAIGHADKHGFHLHTELNVAERRFGHLILYLLQRQHTLFYRHLIREPEAEIFFVCGVHIIEIVLAQLPRPMLAEPARTQVHFNRSLQQMLVLFFSKITGLTCNRQKSTQNQIDNILINHTELVTNQYRGTVSAGSVTSRNNFNEATVAKRDFRLTLVNDNIFYLTA